MISIVNMEHQRHLQQRIRQDVEERNDALKDLSVWMDTLKVAKNKPTRSDIAECKTEVNFNFTGGTNEEIRMKGNELFEQKRYKEAIDCYTRCLEENETSAVFANRSLAHLKIKAYKRAEDDATSALKSGKADNRSKALFIRSKARFSLGKLRAALLDISTAQKNSCKTEAMKQEAETMKSKIEKALADAVGRAPRRRVKMVMID